MRSACRIARLPRRKPICAMPCTEVKALSITGAPGTGKTTLIDDLLAGTRDLGFSVARLVSAQVEADDILRMVAAEFGLRWSYQQIGDPAASLRAVHTQLQTGQAVTADCG